MRLRKSLLKHCLRPVTATTTSTSTRFQNSTVLFQSLNLFRDCGFGCSIPRCDVFSRAIEDNSLFNDHSWEGSRARELLRVGIDGRGERLAVEFLFLWQLASRSTSIPSGGYVHHGKADARFGPDVAG